MLVLACCAMHDSERVCAYMRRVVFERLSQLFIGGYFLRSRWTVFSHNKRLRYSLILLLNVPVMCVVHLDIGTQIYT